MGAPREHPFTIGSSQTTGEIARILTTPGWAAPHLGSKESWPQVLRTVVDLILGTPLPMAVLWGDDATLLYNDAFAAVLGTRHPNLLGTRIGEASSDARPAASLDPEQRIREFCSSLESQRASTNVSCSPIRDEKGRLVGALAILTPTEPNPGRAHDVPRAESQPPAANDGSLRAAHHRLKNVLQLVSSLINLQANEVDDTQVRALFQKTRNRVHCIASIHEMIYASRRYDAVDVAALAGRIVPDLVGFYDCGDRVQARVQGEIEMLEVERAVPFGLLLHELVSNACRHAFPSPSRGEIKIQVGREGNCSLLTVADTGAGIPKDLNYESGTTLGLRLIHLFVKQLRGQLRIEPGPGACIAVRFPGWVPKQENGL